jgi:hypothetical protein
MAEIFFFFYIALLLGGVKVLNLFLDWTYPSLTEEEKFATRNKVVKPWNGK